MMARQKHVIRIQMNTNSSENRGQGGSFGTEKKVQGGNTRKIRRSPTGKTEKGGNKNSINRMVNEWNKSWKK